MACPCCGNPSIARDPSSRLDGACPACDHRWQADTSAPRVDYASQRYRNEPASASHQRKIDDRMATLLPLLRPGMRILEIGCAEASLGATIKRTLPVSYTGIEPSTDGRLAASVLDRVLPTTTLLGSEQFDLLLCFHVVEHMADISAEIASWRQLMAPGATLVLEVPHRAGHPWLSQDPNPEHLHQFSAASVAALLQRSGFELRSLDASHWESALYPDSLRARARLAIDPARQRALLLERFHALLPGPFLAWGIGGDFRGHVEPLLETLPVAALIDGSRHIRGTRIGRFQVEAYDPGRHSGLPVLICSLRYRASIQSDIERLGISAGQVVGLDEIFDTTAP